MAVTRGDAAPRSAPVDRRGWFLTRLLLVGLVAVVGLGLLVWGRGPGKLDDLTSALAAGRLDQVTVVGTGLPAGATGCATQVVVWREHLVARQVSVLVETSGVNDCSTQTTRRLPPGVRDAATFVRQLDPDVAVHHEPERMTTFNVGPWEGPWPFALLAFLGMLVQLFVIISGPQPWRATRWAWFWLSGSLVGVLAMALLSGPFPGVPAPRRPERRLTGGWAFLLGVLLTSAGVGWVFGWA